MAELSTTQILEAAFDAIDHVDEAENFVDKIKEIAKERGSAELLKNANQMLELIQNKNSNTALTVLNAGEMILTTLQDVVGPPFAPILGLMGKMCGLAGKAEANREASLNLTYRLLALRPAVLELTRRTAGTKDRTVKEIETALGKAFALVSKCVPPPADPEDGIFKGFLNFGKKVISQVTSSTTDFAEVHLAIDQALQNFNFRALVQAPTKKQLQDMIEMDAAVLRQQMEDLIRTSLEKANDTVRQDLMKIQNDINAASQSLSKKTDQLATQVQLLLRREEYMELRVDEDRVKIISEETLGSGGNGVVAKALLDEGTLIVAKCSKSKGTKRPTGTKQQQDAAAQQTKDEAREILEEARLLMRYPHPNIIRCYGITVKKQNTFLLLEYCLLNLHDAVERATRERRLPSEVAAVILLKTSASLLALHRAGQVHRDVKAQNVMVREDGELFLIDLGSAKAEVNASVSTTQTMGRNMDAAGTTLQFAPPEILRTLTNTGAEAKVRATKKCDIYSFGMLMYFVLTGQVPFGDENPFQLYPKIITEKFRPEIPQNGTPIPKPLVKLMKDCWHDDPDARPRIDQVRDRLTMFLQEETDAEDPLEWLDLWKKFYLEHIKDADKEHQTAASNVFDGGMMPVCQADELLASIAEKCRKEGFPDDDPTLSEIVAFARDSLGIPTATAEIFISIPSPRGAPVTVSLVCAFFLECLKQLHAQFSKQDMSVREFVESHMTKLPADAVEHLKQKGKRYDAKRVPWIEFCMCIDALFGEGDDDVPAALSATAAPAAEMKTPVVVDNEALLPFTVKLFLAIAEGPVDGSAATPENSTSMTAAVDLLKRMGFRDVSDKELRRREIRRGRVKRSAKSNDVPCVTIDAFCDFVKIVLEDIYFDAPVESFQTIRNVRIYLLDFVDVPPVGSAKVAAAENAALEKGKDDCIAFHDFVKIVDGMLEPLLSAPAPGPVPPSAPPATTPSVAVRPPAETMASESKPEPPAPTAAKHPQGSIREFETRHDAKGCTIVLNGKDVVTLVDHNSDVYCISFHPDGRRVAVAIENVAAPIKIWSLETGKAITSLKGHKDMVSCLTFNSTGSFLASGSSDKTAKVYNMTTGKAMCTLHGHSSDVTSVCFSADSSMVVTGSDDTTAGVWDVAKGTLINNLVGHSFWVRAVAFSNDGQTVATGSSDQTVKLWDPRSGNMKQSIAVGAAVSHVAFNANGDRVLVTLEGGATGEWSASDGNKL